MIKIELKHIFLLLVISISLLFAQEKTVRLTASAKEVLSTDIFELEITLENFGGNASMEQPDFDKDLQLVNGPFQSHSTSIVNGRSTSSITLTYQFTPKKTGNITIPPITIIEDGKRYRSNKVIIKVFDSPKNMTGTSAQDMFITTEISNRSPYVGEMLKVDYVLYIKDGVSIRMPSLTEEPKMTGFVKENVEYSQQKSKSLVQRIYEGQKYNTLPIKTYWITPTASGEYELNPLIISVPVEEKKKKKRRSMFDDPFFNDDLFSGFTNFKDRAVRSKNIKISVNELPATNKPDSYSGGVGSFKLRSTIDNDSVDVNEAITLKITISGTGNFRDITNIKPDIPSDFEVYDPKSEIILDKDSKTDGRVVFEYILVPRAPGKHVIKGVEFTYFDSKKKKYQTLTDKDYSITVTGSANGKFVSSAGYSRKEIEVLAKDIRYIKKTGNKFYRTDQLPTSFFNFFIYLIIAILLPLLTYALNSVFSKKRADVSGNRKRKAANFAKKRLKIASSYLGENDHIGFYKSIEEALYKFLADKFNLSHAGIVFDDIKAELERRNIKEELINELQTILNKTSSIQFSPEKPNVDEMTTDIERTSDLIMDLSVNLK
ncbi:MAG: protein BatD [Candidatus Delongbacteria bacterium]|nr:protein BatD [Candidatus Delongbacteria bacterium]